jgi:hypothetical protein
MWFLAAVAWKGRDGCVGDVREVVRSVVDVVGSMYGYGILLSL